MPSFLNGIRGTARQFLPETATTTPSNERDSAPLAASPHSQQTQTAQIHRLSQTSEPKTPTIAHIDEVLSNHDSQTDTSTPAQPSQAHNRPDSPPLPFLSLDVLNSAVRTHVPRPNTSHSTRSFWRAQSRQESQQPIEVLAGREWWWKRPELKTRLVILGIWGVLLVVIFSTYLGIALNKRIATEDFHVTLILILLVTAMFFCHSLVRLCLLAAKRYSYPDEMNPTAEIYHLASGPGLHGYAQPEQPIRVEPAPGHSGAALNDDTDPTKLPPPPPAYGLWRQSVRVNPDQFYWVRRSSAELRAAGETITEEVEDRGRRREDAESPVESSRRAVQRPPSYGAHSGADLERRNQEVLALQQEVPSQDYALPPHPSEIGRGAFV